MEARRSLAGLSKIGEPSGDAMTDVDAAEYES